MRCDCADEATRLPGNYAFMSNIFVLSQYVDASQNSTGYYFSRLIEGLRGQFVALDVIPNSPFFSRHNGATYFSSVSNKNRLLRRVLEQIVVAFRFFLRVCHRLKKGDVLITGTNPALMLLWIPLVKRVLGFRWCLIVHDVFPDNLVPANVLTRESVFYPVLNRIFSWVYGSADRLIVIGRDMQALLVAKTNNPGAIVYIPNWACGEEVYPMNKSDAAFIRELGWEDKIVFQFFGNIGRLQGIDLILNAIALTENPDRAFLFIGGGAMVGKVQQFIATHPERCIAYAGTLPLAKKNSGLAACDVAIVSLETGMAGLGVPSKSYFTMAADKQILAIMDSDAEIASVVKDHRIGWHAEPVDPAKLAVLIDSISNADIDRMKGRPRAVFQELYSEPLALTAWRGYREPT